MSDTPTWTLDNAPEPTYDWANKKMVYTRGWYVEIGCSDADEMMFEGLAGCCEFMVFGPFATQAIADEAGMDLTSDTPPWYYSLREVR